MLAICGAKAGIGITYAMSDIELIPSTSPNIAIPIGRPIAITDPNATSRIDHRGDDADQLADPGLGLLEGEEQVAAELDLQRRPGALLGGERLQALEVGGAQLLEDRILDADDGHAAVG